MSRFRWVAGAGLAGLALLAAGGPTCGRQAAPSGPLPPGTKAVRFEARSLSGAQIRFPAGYQGKLVLLDFWATWCPPCRAEIPHLRRAYELFRPRGLEIIGVSLDQARGVSQEQLRSFAEKHGLRWALIYDGAERIAYQYGVRYIPAPFLIDGDSGQVLARGEALKGSALLESVERHLSAGPAGRR